MLELDLSLGKIKCVWWVFYALCKNHIILSDDRKLEVFTFFFSDFLLYLLPSVWCCQPDLCQKPNWWSTYKPQVLIYTLWFRYPWFCFSREYYIFLRRWWCFVFLPFFLLSFIVCFHLNVFPSQGRTMFHWTRILCIFCQRVGSKQSDFPVQGNTILIYCNDKEFNTLRQLFKTEYSNSSSVFLSLLEINFDFFVGGRLHRLIRRCIFSVNTFCLLSCL